MSDYYDFKVCHIDTDTTFEETRRVDANGREFTASSNDVDDPETNVRWSLGGCWMGPELDGDDRLALLKNWGFTGGDCIKARVTDNGEMGEGLWLEFSPAARHGNPESNPERWGDGWSEKSPRLLFSLRLTATQARILGETLISAGRIRDAQGAEI